MTFFAANVSCEYVCDIHANLILICRRGENACFRQGIDISFGIDAETVVAARQAWRRGGQ
jgi:hypothetical protein